jgi:trimeric autotransporter adhesin
MHIRTDNFVRYFDALMLAICLTLLLGAPTTLPAQQQKETTAKAQASVDPQDAASAIIVGRGTANTIPVFTGSHTINNSLITETGNGISVNGTAAAVSFTGSGSGLTNVNASTLSGLSSSSFAQTGMSNTFTADQTINGNLNVAEAIDSALMLQGNLTDSDGEEGANVIGGFTGNAAFPGNSVAPGVIGATIAGGGGAYDPSLIPAAAAPQRWARRTAERAGSRSQGRRADGSPPPNGMTSGSNTVTANWGTVGGGLLNSSGGTVSTVVGGYANDASGAFATVAGGYSNVATGLYSTVSGGFLNTSAGNSSTVPGGYGNNALGDYSFAGGCEATTSYPGSFVWAGGINDLEFCSATSDTQQGQFVVAASGGFYFYTSTSGASGSGATLASGSGSWSSLSDRNIKAHFLAIDPSSLLEKIAAMPISTWNYKTQDDSIRHLGPTAQDFHEAFGLGEDDKHISTVDAQGVALAGVQALYQTVMQLKQNLADKDQEISDLRTRLANLEQFSSKP